MQKWIVLITVCWFSLLSCRVDKKISDAAKRGVLDSAIVNKNFIFSPMSAMPMGGSSVNLSLGYYSIAIKNDSLKVFMPYYGRAYAAPLNASEGGFKLNTTNFTYQAAALKKGVYKILIVPKETTMINTPRDIRSITMSLSHSGYGTVSIASFSKQQISFYGNVMPNP